MRGNFYVLRKFLGFSYFFHRFSLWFELTQLFVLYYVFLGAIFVSHAIFVFAGMGWIAVQSPGPYFAIWICAYVLFVAELMLAASYEEEASALNGAVALLMYLTYCQVWILLIIRAVYQEKFLGGKVGWEKTRRFAPVEMSAKEAAEPVHDPAKKE